MIRYAAVRGPTRVAVLLAVAACATSEPSTVSDKLAEYATVRLTADLSGLTDRQRAMIDVLIEAAKPMDEIFWEQSHGNRDSLLAAISDPDLRRLVEINYGPWDRLGGDAPLIDGVGQKPAGANLYPRDITRAEFESELDTSPTRADSLRSLYTLVRRSANGLTAVPYHVAFEAPVSRSVTQLRQAAVLADDPGLRRYLELRASALLTDDYRESDRAWMDMKDNVIDVIIGPIETYEDQFMGLKASYEAYVLVKDMEWSARLARYADLLPDLQRSLPVLPHYKQEVPGTDSDLNAYDVLYYAGEANAGSKTIAINLPNDEAVQLEKGTRRLQLKNAMRAKFDSILVPIADLLIDPEQRQHITFDSFFANTMFHEVAHGLGIKNTITRSGSVREALREHASAFEEGKADILGLYMITRLMDQGIEEGDRRDNYVTFLASILRSVRFGASSAHGRANMMRFNFFEDRRAFTRDPATGTYRVDYDRMTNAMNSLSEMILMIQGDGDYERAGDMLSQLGVIRTQLQGDLDRLSRAGVPVDIVFEQGQETLNIQP